MSLCTIVGVGPGIGLSVAKRFAQEGFDIAMIARSADRLNLYSKFLEDEYSAKSFGFMADVSHFDQLEGVLKEIHKQHGSTDVLVYNAAVVQKTKPLVLSAANHMYHLAVDVGGAIVSVHKVLPEMLQKGEGTILFTGGNFATEPSSEHYALSMGKAALRNFGLNLAQEYAPKGIHIAVVSVHGKVTDPYRIANTYWNLHTQSREKWEPEVQVR